MTRNALGRGLGALIREPEPQIPPQVVPETVDVVVEDKPYSVASSGAAAAPARDLNQTLQVDIDLIVPSPHQPRTNFRESALEELSRSIAASGIIQPLLLRPAGDHYELIAGERRWRAAQLAGLTKVPAIVRQVSDDMAMEMTLVENIQREDLNAIESARAFDRLINEFNMTPEMVAERTGKERTTISNAIRLLKLESTIQEWIEEGKLTAGHGRALLAVPDSQLRMRYAHRAARGGLTVRQIERLAARRSRARTVVTREETDANTRSAIDELQRALGTKILLRPHTKSHPGQLIVEFYDDAHLIRLYDQLMK
jgi:ParB family transcriptional regulator, chromosome partitioning protein